MPAWRWRIQARGLGLGFAILALVACATPEPPSGVENRDWYLVAIGADNQVAANEAARPTLRLESEGARAAGFAGCNRFAGHYVLTGEQLKFGPLAATKMYCEQAQSVEDRYLGALGSVVSWSVAADALTLSSDSGPVLRFRELTPTRRVK
jgi:heat shock protein HslJ